MKKEKGKEEKRSERSEGRDIDLPTSFKISFIHS